MGSNFSDVGIGTIDNFAQSMFRSEAEHLRTFLGYVRHNALDAHLINHNWAAFANGYNGPGYAMNHYDVRIRNAFTDISASRHRLGLAP